MQKMATERVTNISITPLPDIRLAVRDDGTGAGQMVYRYGDGVSPSVLPYSDIREPLNMRTIVPFFGDVFEQSAILSAVSTQEMHHGGKVLSEEEKKLYKKRLDNRATDVVRTRLNNGIYLVKMNGFEGLKEVVNHGLDAEVDHIDGFLGPHSGLNVEGVGDVIEGTDATAKNEPGGSSIFALSSRLGHPDIPSEKISDAKYLNRLIVGPELKGRVFFGMDPREIVAEAMKAYGLNGPDELTVSILDRKRNARRIERYEMAGVNLQRLKAGDLLPGLGTQFMGSRRISDGSGGIPEGWIAGWGAGARGGDISGRYEDAEGNESKDFPGVHPHEYFCPGTPAEYAVVFTSITGSKDDGFDLSPVKFVSRDSKNNTAVCSVNSVTITQEGIVKILRPVVWQVQPLVTLEA